MVLNTTVAPSRSSPPRLRLSNFAASMILLATAGHLVGVMTVLRWEGGNWNVLSTLDTVWAAVVTFPVIVPAALTVGWVVHRCSAWNRTLTAIAVALVSSLIHPLGFVLALRASADA
jgi:hypothetical protein